MELGDASLLYADVRDNGLLPVDIIGCPIEGKGRRLVEGVLLRVDDRAVAHVDSRRDDRELLCDGVEEDPRISVAVDGIIGEEHDCPVAAVCDALLAVERNDERIEENDGVAPRMTCLDGLEIRQANESP